MSRPVLSIPITEGMKIFVETMEAGGRIMGWTAAEMMAFRWFQQFGNSGDEFFRSLKPRIAMLPCLWWCIRLKWLLGNEESVWLVTRLLISFRKFSSSGCCVFCIMHSKASKWSAFRKALKRLPAGIIPDLSPSVPGIIYGEMKLHFNFEKVEEYSLYLMYLLYPFIDDKGLIFSSQIPRIPDFLFNGH